MKRKKRIETLKNRIASSYVTYFVDFICEDEIYFRNGINPLESTQNFYILIVANWKIFFLVLIFIICYFNIFNLSIINI